MIGVNENFDFDMFWSRVAPQKSVELLWSHEGEGEEKLSH